MNRFCLVNPLDGRREAPDSKRMESAAMSPRYEGTSLKSSALVCCIFLLIFFARFCFLASENFRYLQLISPRFPFLSLGKFFPSSANFALFSLSQSRKTSHTAADFALFSIFQPRKALSFVSQLRLGSSFSA